MKKRALPIILLLVFTLVISACKPEATMPQPVATEPEPAATPTTQVAMEETPEPDASEGWWNDAVFYEIFVRSFKDSDGDGIGDFRGIIEMLDYLNDGDPNTDTDLGIGGIWLMPINPSPSYHGYDVTDYQAVNPDYGTMQDFQDLLAACHERGIRVIIDFVVNHTSSEHPWFLSSKDKSSEYRDWYVWSDTKPTQAGPWGQNAWYESGESYYYAIFWSGMPDLNYDQPKVTEAMYDATKFWLDLGVDGFRVDAARYLVEEGIALQDSKGSIEWFQNWRAYYTDINPEAYTIGEVWTDTQVIAKYGQPTRGMQEYFMFDLAGDILGGLFAPDPSRIMKSYLETLEYFPDQQFATFLTNHDQQRVASFFSNKLQRQQLAAFIYLTGPGTPYIYYGEEIGMTGNKPDEYIRTPMQWSAEAHAGFSDTTPWQPLNEGWEELNVAAQDEDPGSLLNWYRGLVNLRNRYPALQKGDYIPFTSSCRRLYTVARVLDDEVLLTVANLGVQTLENCTIALEDGNLVGTWQAESVWGKAPFSEITFAEDGSLTDFFVAEMLDGGETFILKLTRP
ncbi:MAG TPA: alpha-amylase family glycosyl hydrolase [Anaerolineaceae bacterium]|nr:alpha-amylase family glycosyl hydrolase [Anaerolineaceae bacterium]